MKKTYSRLSKSIAKIALGLSLIAVQLSFSQAVNYGFSQNSGVYEELTDATVIATATSVTGAGSLDTDKYQNIALPFSFPFAGNSFTSLTIHPDGFVSFGATPPNGSTPISNTITAFSGAIAAVATDLHALFNIDGYTGSISTKEIGEAPNQEFVIEWKNFRPYVNSTSTASYFNWSFQIHLKQDGTIDIVYDLRVTGTPTSTTAQVGIRGVLATDYNNRYAGGTATNNWMSTSPGSGNTSVVFCNSTSLPVSGYTFTWVPPAACVAPEAQPTAFLSTVDGIVVTGNFTASDPNADKYLVIRTPQGTIPNAPVDGTNYTNGVNASLNGRVIYIGTNTTFTDNAFSGIVGNTNYTYTIYALSSACTGGPLYNVADPLTADVTTCPGSINTISAANATPTAFTLNWTPNNGDAVEYHYNLLVATDSAFTNEIEGSPFEIASDLSSFTVTNLLANTKYFYKIQAVSTCSGLFSSAGNITTLCNPVASLNETFTGITTSNPLTCWTTTGWEIGSLRGAIGVNGSTNIFKNLYSSAATGVFTTITAGPIAAHSELNFDYKQSDYYSPYPALLNWGKYIVQVSTDSGANWTTILTVDNEQGTGSYIHKTIALTEYVGDNVTFKITATRTAGDYDLSFDNFEIKVNTPVCDGAEPGENPGDTGCITLTYDGVTQTYATVRAADGNIWLQQNLGSTAIASQMDDADSYGDLFQWGRWADGHQKRTSQNVSVTPDPNNPLGLESVSGAYITSSPGWWATNALTDQWAAADVASITATNSCDPCKALGEGWKLPTQEDWTTVVDAEDIGNPATAFASTLKLPANGYRSSSNGGFTFVGQRGYYWSSTSTGIGGKYLYIGSTIANPGSGAMRAQGAGIRCMKYATAVTCPVVETFSYNFDDFTTFPEQCWTASHTGFMFSVIGTSDKAVQIYSFTSPNDEFFMISPAVSTIDGQHALKFDVKAIAEGSKIQVGTLKSQTDFSEFAAIGDAFTPSLQDSYVSIALPAIEDHQYVAIKFIPNGLHKNISIDNVKWDLVDNLGTGSFEKQTISLYPNPTNDFVTIVSNELIKQVQIYNQLGQLIGTQKSNTVDLSSYASGVYLLQIELDNSIITTRKVIKK